MLEDNYSEWEFDRDRFAAGLHMSVRTLTRKLKAVTGRTPVELIYEFRMQRAAELLANTSYSVTEITFQVGCDDSANFTRMFKKHYDMTPTEYRTSQKR